MIKQMRTPRINLLALAFLVMGLQGCYTMVNPPDTLPETATTVVASPGYSTSVGYGTTGYWDPYWEPSLLYTGGFNAWGSSYYSPYNYYDYRHHYYQPVYPGYGGGGYVGGGDDRSGDPPVGRDFNRDGAGSGGGRSRDANPPPAVAKPADSGSSPVRPAKPDPVPSAPAVAPVRQTAPAGDVTPKQPVVSPKPQRNKEVQRIPTVNPAKSTSTSNSSSSSSESKDKKTRKRR